MLRNFTTAIGNVFMFLPYYFSVTTLLKTLFAPWRNLTETKTTAGFSFNEWWSRFTFNIVSRLIGAMVRTAVLLGYLLIMMLFVIFLPLIFVLYILFMPILQLFASGKKSDEEVFAQQKELFIKNHLLDPKNRAAVETWFNSYHQTAQKLPWYDKNRLFSTPPLGRYFSAGYTPTLDQYSTELTAGFAHYDHLVDRKNEIAQMEQILSKSDAANILLVGEEGVGKHTVVEALAKRIYEGTSNPILAFKRILKIDVEKILGVSNEYIQREQIVKTLLTEAANAGNIIIFIDEFDRYISTDTHRIDLSSVFAEFAAGHKLQFITITSPYAYQKYVFKNDKINSLFTRVNIPEVSKEDAVQILLEAIVPFENRLHVLVPYETIITIIEKSSYYITTIPFPEKAISLLDEVCSLAVSQNKSVVMPEMVLTLIEQKTHVPQTLTADISQKLLNLESQLSNRVVAQSEAVTKLAAALRKSFVLSQKRAKPLASLLFLGPTGVGKTETAKAVTKTFFGDDSFLIRFDMSLYQSTQNIPQLIGAPETGEAGFLSQTIRERTYGVLLLDELEKANKDLLNIFLTVFDEGYFTDGFGKRVDCRNLIIIATSNAGADFIYQNIQTLVTAGDFGTTLINHLVENHVFSPEFLNRFDDIVVFKPLSKEAILTLSQKMIESIGQDIKGKYGVSITVSPQYLEQLTEKGYNPAFGARNMARVIREGIEDKISMMILEKKVSSGQTIAF